MEWYLTLGGLLVGFIMGFFVGGKHKERVMNDLNTIKDLGKKL